MSEGYYRDTWCLVQSALKCNEIEKAAEVKPSLGDTRAIQRSENSATHNDVSFRQGTSLLLEAPQWSARTIHGERWFFHNFCYFGRVHGQQAGSQRGTAGCEEWTVESSGMGRTVWRERRACEAWVWVLSQGCQVQPFPSCLYTCFLQNIAHSSCSSVRLSRSLDHSVIPQETHLLVVAR